MKTIPIQLTAPEIKALLSLAKEGWCDGWLMDNERSVHLAGIRAMAKLDKAALPPQPKAKRSAYGNRQCFPGIVEDAKELGVSREHLYRVLIGERPSAVLVRRYRDLKIVQKNLAAQNLSVG